MSREIMRLSGRASGALHGRHGGVDVGDLHSDLDRIAGSFGSGDAVVGPAGIEPTTSTV